MISSKRLPKKEYSTMLIQKWWWLGMVVLFIWYSFFSFSLTDPNLVITSWQPYWQWQLWMWQVFFNNSVLLSWGYGSLITMLLGWWLLGMWSHRNLDLHFSAREFRQLLWLLLLLALPLLISYNALSHDVFNYMFNAKMAWYYQANPHVQVALEFPQDDWLRFMHNTHTPAPYGYGWTALSIPISVVGANKFITTWLWFRVASLASLVILAASTWWMVQKTRSSLPFWQWLLVFGNPLVLIEIISNSHNDLWMMWPAVLAFGLLSFPKTRTWQLILTAALLAFSVSIKLATIVLVPVAVLLWWRPNEKVLRTWWPVMASVLMFLPLLSDRSQQFHPWYLTWSLVWVPFLNFKALPKATQLWPLLLAVFSVSSLWRYWPWLRWGQFTAEVILQQKLITWIPALLVLTWWIGRMIYRRWQK